jgi:hypothetical protein
VRKHLKGSLNDSPGLFSRLTGRPLCNDDLPVAGLALEGMQWQGAIANILRDFLFERDKRFDIPMYLACIVEITSVEG